MTSEIDKQTKTKRDILTYATCFNFLRICDKYAYVCKPNFLKEKLHYCLSNNIISEDLIKEPFFKDKVIKKCEHLEMMNPYKPLSYDTQSEKMYWTYDLYKIKLPIGWKLQGGCNGICNVFYVIDSHGDIIKEFPFFKNYDSIETTKLDVLNSFNI